MATRNIFSSPVTLTLKSFDSMTAFRVPRAKVSDGTDPSISALKRFRPAALRSTLKVAAPSLTQPAESGEKNSTCLSQR